ncbi:MAG: 30S ribosomal protein S17 [Parachlamydiales bacterium]|nr:30S ribosomal protein S17 [Parachlamydiales bacterium]
MPKTKKKIIQGVVVSDKMNKTIVVKVTRKIRHPRYQKLVEKWKKYYAHDEKNVAKVGATVRIEETRPLSKLKRFRVVEVL